MYDEMRRKWIWLSSIEGLGLKRFYKLLSIYEDPRAVWDDAGPGLRILGDAVYRQLLKCRSQGYIDEMIEGLEQKKMVALTRLDEGYPPLLQHIVDPPPTLFVRGRADFSDTRAIAIVGTRRASINGKRAAEEFGCALAECGVTVVSGAARGVDTHAHIGALRAGARTVAVLGCGADVVYPSENDKLFERILASGGSVISEYRPGTPPIGQHFPARNRIISGMCRGTVVVEGEKRSGASITADFAMEEGRDVFAVPGGIYAALSQLPNALIRDGAIPALSPADILSYYGWQDVKVIKRPDKAAPELDGEEKKVAEALKQGEMTFDELLQETGIDVTKLNSLLTMLELRGIIKQSAGRLYHIMA